MSIRLDQDQARHFIVPDMGPNCLQKLSAEDTSRQGVKSFERPSYCICFYDSLLLTLK